mgnify:FL=1
MNNSKITLDNLSQELETNKVSFLEKEQGRLIQLVEAINRVESSEDWQKLKVILLDEIVISLEKQLVKEADKKEINAPEIYRLQGQLVWARKYGDLKKLSDWYKFQIEGIRQQLKNSIN